MNESVSRWLKLCGALLGMALPGMAWAEPLSAAQALDEALRHNPTLRAAVSELTAAQALSTRESARLDASVLVSVAATHNKNPSLSPGTSSVLLGTNDVAETNATLQKTLSGGTQVSASVGATASRSSSPYVFSSAQGTAEPLVLVTGPGYLLSAKLGVVQPLLRGTGSEVTLAPYRQALAQQTASEREESRTANALARDVLVAYWELWYATKSLAVDRAAQQTALAQRDDAARRRNTGSLSAADVLTFETQLAIKEEAILQSELELSSRQNELGRLLGRERGAQDLEVSEPSPPAAAAVSDDVLALALERSPEISASQANVKVAEVQQLTAADSYRPRLDLDAYAQSQGLGNRDVSAAFSQIGGLGALSAHVGLTLELPLTGTRYSSESRRARALLDGSRHQLDATRNQLTAEVATALRKRELAQRRISLATAGAGYAQQQLAAKRSLFATGSATALEVTQAEDAVQAAGKREVRARADLAQADLVIAYHVDALLQKAVATR